MATSTLGNGTLVLAGTTSGTTTVTATAVAGTTTLTLPAATDTLVGKATTDTLTNKTLTGAAMNGTVGATTPSTGAFTTLTSTGASSFATSSGNVGIGASATGTSGFAANKTFEITGASAPAIIFRPTGSTSEHTVGGAGDGVFIGATGAATASNNAIRFFTSNTNSSTTPTECSRFDSSGNLLVGTTTSRAPITIGKAAITANSGQLSLFSPTAADTATTGISITKYANDSTTSQIFAVFLINQATNGSGQINANGANAAAFGAFSDSRLKENIADLPSQLANIMALRPVEFDYIESEGGGHQIGFIAQEVQAIYPDLVGERKDGMLTLSDMNKNDARLIKAIQEQQVLITQLTARITALESA